MPRSHTNAQLLQEIQTKDAQLARQQAELAAQDAELVRVRQELKLLQQKLDHLIRQLFGAKSERLDPAQLLLLWQQWEAPGPAEGKGSGPDQSEALCPVPPMPAAPRSRRNRAPRLPEHLPVIEERIVPVQVQASPEQWRQIGEEISERLDYQPARFQRLRTVRPKYVRRAENEAAPVIAPLPPCFQERSIATPGLVAQILVAKYCDHLPLYRQEKIYERRHGVYLPRQTMAQWVGVAADWLRLIYEEIRTGVMRGGYVQIDETPVRYLAPGHGKTKQGYFWTAHRPGADVVYAWQTSRAATCLQALVPVDFTGIIQCDGYAGYEAFCKAHEHPLELVGCWAHLRRYFHEALAESPKHAGLILYLLQKLYRIEEQLRRRRAGPKSRHLTRWQQSRPLVERLRQIIGQWRRQGRFLPRSLMGQAVHYAWEQWSGLLPYLHDGRLEIDNNLVENAIRPTAVGKKNWLFIGEAQAGDRGAVIYTIVESCKRRGLDPYAYLREVLTRLPSLTTSQIREFTPEAWARTQRAAAQAAAA